MRRRHFLETAAGLALVRRAAAGDDELVRFADYGPEFTIEAQAANPRVKCFDLRRLNSAAVPPGEFFSFHQTTTVRGVELRAWRLSISGAVSRPAVFTYDELLRRPQVTVAATIECSGNSGNAGLMNGLVSTGVWRGPALGGLLRECGVAEGAREVVFFGLDRERERKWPAGEREFEVPHGRSVFVQDALGGDAVLATELNGKPLDAERGFPVRLILPGWYGMTQVKWLDRIVVLDRRYEGRHMARNYHSIQRAPGGAEPLWLETSISRMRLKSVITRVIAPRASSGLEPLIHGAAWSGGDRVSKVELRIDDGPWREARVVQDGGAYAWSLWSAQWPDATPGRHTLTSRATDARGRIQPTRDEWRQTFASAREDNSQWPRLVDVARS